VTSTTYTGVSITGTGSGTGLPYPFTDTDVGGAAPAGSASFASGVFTVKGGGNDIWGGTDQFHYADQPVDGDVSVIARVTAQSITDPWAKSGVMIKQSAAAGAPYAMVAVTPGNGIHFQYGFNSDGGARDYTLPDGWVRLDRTGSVFTAYTSTDGSNWEKLGQAVIAMTNSATVGLAVSAHSAALNTTSFDNVLVTPLGAGPVPAPWIAGDVGGPPIPGSAAFSAADGNVFTLNGGGGDIWGTNDQFQYVQQPLTGNGTITVRVTSQDLTNPWAKSGIMIKQSTTVGSPYVLLAVTPGNGVHLQWGYANDIAGGTFDFPNGWLRLNRTGDVFTASVSADGTAWTQVGQATVTMTAPVTIGMFANSHRADQLNTTTFDNVIVGAS
jgi:regulation of enolase protein 1 (concanavalin A-like superfamily)